MRLISVTTPDVLLPGRAFSVGVHPQVVLSVLFPHNSSPTHQMLHASARAVKGSFLVFNETIVLLEHRPGEEIFSGSTVLVLAAAAGSLPTTELSSASSRDGASAGRRRLAKAVSGTPFRGGMPSPTINQDIRNAFPTSSENQYSIFHLVYVGAENQFPMVHTTTNLNPKILTTLFGPVSLRGGNEDIAAARGVSAPGNRRSEACPAGISAGPPCPRLQPEWETRENGETFRAGS